MKKYLNFIILLLFIFVMIQILLNSNVYISCIQDSIVFWKDRLVTTILPFLLLSEFLINYGFINIINLIIGPFFKFLFNINSNVVYVFFMSLLSGFPGSAIYINNLYQKKLISYESANKALIICHFPNPLFIIGFIGNSIGIKYGYYILFIHYLSTIIIGIIYRKYDNGLENNNRFICDKFGTVLRNSIKKSIDNLLLILGTIIFFNILNTTLNFINLPPVLKSFFNMFLELSNGINFVIDNYDIKLQCLFISIILSFGGLCVHFQVLSILEESKIKYQRYLISRILHSLISGILVLITFNIMV